MRMVDIWVKDTIGVDELANILEESLHNDVVVESFVPNIGQYEQWSKNTIIMRSKGLITAEHRPYFRFLKLVGDRDILFLKMEQYGDKTITPGGQNFEQPYSFIHIAEFEFKDGKIIYWRNHVDTFKAMIQSGKAIMKENNKEMMRNYLQMLIDRDVISDEMIRERLKN